MITNTHSVGVVRDAVIEWIVKRGRSFDWSLPVVAETWDGTLNDINGFHVTQEHVFARARQRARRPVAEGNVGGGTGMMCHGFKGGIGTSSRKLTEAAGGYTVGVLVQCNYGTRRPAPHRRRALDVVRRHHVPTHLLRAGPAGGRGFQEVRRRAGSEEREELGSIIIVVATDAPVMPHQLKRIVKRAALGVGRMGGIGGNTSGDIFIAFSTANPESDVAKGTAAVTMLGNSVINPLFAATVDATEEAILNAMVAARDHDRRRRSSGARDSARPDQGAPQGAQPIAAAGCWLLATSYQLPAASVANGDQCVSTFCSPLCTLRFALCSRPRSRTTTAPTPRASSPPRRAIPPRGTASRNCPTRLAPASPGAKTWSARSTGCSRR